MTVQEGTETPSAITTDVQDQAITTDAATDGATTSTDSPATSSTQAPETVLSDEDEILRDMKDDGDSKESADDKDAEAKDENGKDGDDNDDVEPELPESLKRMRDENLKTKAQLDERERAIAERESALQSQDQRTTSDDTAEADTAPTDLLSSWEKLRGEIKETWETYDAPGEQRLVAFLDAVVPQLAQMQEAFAYVQQQQVTAQATQIAGAIQDAANQVKATYGFDIEPIALAGMIQNGGLEAVAKVKGVDPRTLTPSPELFLEVYEIANAAALREVRTKPAEAPKPKPAIPDNNRGGGTRTSNAPLTDEDEIRADLSTAQSGRTVR